jgi:hypothetical protein
LNYVLAGGVLVGHSDDDGLGEPELGYSIEMIMPLASDPEESIASITTVARAEQMLDESAAWMRENTGEIRYTAFKNLCIIAAVESLTPSEDELLHRIAEMTGIPRRCC